MLKVLQRSWCPAGCAPNPNSNPNPGSTVAAHCVGSKALFSSAAAGVAGVKSATGFSSSGFSCIRRLCRLRARHAAQARAAVGRGARPGCVRACASARRVHARRVGRLAPARQAMLLRPR